MAGGDSTKRVLMVCLGNICRSPTAKVVMQKLAKERGANIFVDSCGTAGYHVGEGAHSDTIAAAKARGYDLSKHRARQLKEKDFDNFDYIVCMDRSNERNVRSKFKSKDLSKVSQLCSYASKSDLHGHDEVPDPYYSGGFDVVVDICEAGCKGLLDEILK